MAGGKAVRTEFCNMDVVLTLSKAATLLHALVVNEEHHLVNSMFEISATQTSQVMQLCDSLISVATKDAGLLNTMTPSDVESGVKIETFASQAVDLLIQHCLQDETVNGKVEPSSSSQR